MQPAQRGELALLEASLRQSPRYEWRERKAPSRRYYGIAALGWFPLAHLSPLHLQAADEGVATLESQS
jgi:hypothetical protein